MIVGELWHEARKYPRALGASVVFQLLIFATYVSQAIAVATSMAAIVRQDVAVAVGCMFVIVGLSAVRIMAGLAQGKAAVELGGCVQAGLRKRTLEAVLAPDRLHDSTQRDGIARLALSEGIEGTETYVSKYIPAVVQLAIGTTGVLALLTILSPLVAVLIAGAVLVAVLGPMAWKRMLAKRGATHWDSYEALSGDILESLRGMATLRTLGDVPLTRQRLNSRSEELRRATERTMRASLAETAITDVAVQAGVVIAAAVAILDVVNEGATPVEAYVLLLLSSEVFRPVRDLSRQWHAGFLGLSAVPGLRALGAFSVRAHPAIEGRSPASASLRSEPEGSGLVVSHVTFRYPDSSHAVLRDISLQARRGEIHAIIGESGAGKSTLLDVVLGFLTPEAGVVELEGRPLSAADVAVVSQRPVLFAATVRENVDLFGAGDEEVRSACHAAGVLEEIDALPAGFDTPVAEAGSSLSGGQRQRLALARALLTKRPILLVDEPTSSLDDTRADGVVDALEEVSRDRIVLMVSHRCEALRRVSHQYRLTAGALEEASR
jgi:ATP-binding cassette subfamily C protein CydD